MANPIDTPQVILGLDKGGTFQDFEERRRSGGSYLSDWYTEAANKGNIWLSTLENNDVISFSHKFNSDSQDDQSLFVFEILDPTNTFESRFFNTFYKGSTSYEEIMEMYTLNIVAGANVSNSKSDTKRSLTALPFATAMYVTFGMGNDLAGWSPAMKASLATMDYGLTDEGIKKIILRFVANPGASRLNSPKGVENYLKSTSNTKINQTELVMVDSTTSKPNPKGIPYKNIISKGSVMVKNPVNIVFDIFKNVMKSTTKSNVVFLLDELKKPLQTRWNNMVIASARQHIQSLVNIKTVAGENPGLASELEQKALKDLLIASVDGIVTGDELEKGVKVAGLSRVEDEIAEAKKAANSLMGGEWNKGMAEMFPGAGYDPANTPDLYYHGWENNKGYGDEGQPGGYYRSGHDPKKFSKSLKALHEQGDVPEAKMARAWVGGHLRKAADALLGEKQVAAVLKINKKLQDRYIKDLEGPKFDHFIKYFYKYEEVSGDLDERLKAGHTVASNIKSIHGKFKAAMKTEKWKKGPLRYRGPIPDGDRQYPMYHRGNLVDNVKSYYKGLKEEWPQSITLDTVNVYKIFLGAFNNFFGTLGLTTSVGRPSVLKTSGAVPLADSSGEADDPKKLIENLMRKPLYVTLTVDTADELKQELKKMINGLDAGPTIRLTVHSFSELSLIKSLAESVDDDTIIPKGKDSDGSLKTKEILFVTSIRVLSSLVNDTKLDAETEKLMGPVYTSIKHGYKEFNDGEPSIHSSEDVPFSQLFDHPDLEELQLDTDAVLTLFSDKNLQFDDNEKLNKYLLDNNIPVFNYGFKNSNILNFDFYLKPWYAYLLETLPQIALLGAKLPSVKDADVQQSLLKFWKGSNAGKEFTKKIGDYYDKYIENLGKWGPKGSLSWEENEQTHNEISTAVINEQKKVGFVETGGPTSRQSYIDAMTRVYRLSMNNPYTADYLRINSENQDTTMDLLLAIRRQMESKVFTAKITTLPFFSFISLGKVIGKTALLYFMEPEIVASVGSKDKRTRSTWLSGSYLIVGYDVTMSNSRLTTSFNLVKQL